MIGYWPSSIAGLLIGGAVAGGVQQLRVGHAQTALAQAQAAYSQRVADAQAAAIRAQQAVRQAEQRAQSATDAAAVEHAQLVAVQRQAQQTINSEVAAYAKARKNMDDAACVVSRGDADWLRILNSAAAAANLPGSAGNPGAAR